MRAIQMLLSAGRDVRKGDVLHCAVERTPSNITAELIELLVSRGALTDGIEFTAPEASVLRHSFACGTALHQVCHTQNVVAVETLVKLGASRTCPRVSLYRPEHYTPLDAARASGNAKILAMLQELPAELETVQLRSRI